MTITHTEKFVSPSNTSKERDSSKDEKRKQFTLFADAGEDEDAVMTYFIGNVPDTENGLVADKYRLEREESDGTWNGEVTYKSLEDKRKPIEPGEGYRWSVRSAGGQSVKILKSLAFVNESVDPAFAAKWTHAGTGDEIRTLVGWELTPEGASNANGYDLPAGGVEIGVELAISSAQANGGFLVSVAGHAANQAVNNATWNGFAAQTLRFVSYSAIARSGAADAVWDLSYTFDFNPSETVTVQGLSVEKAGQHLLDVITEYKPVDATDGFTLPFIIRLATHQIRPEINYSTELGI